MSIFGKTGRQYWQDELQKMMGITSGATLPQELPEFKGMANMFNSQSNNQMANVIRQMSQKGITGGAAAGAISGMDENNKSGLLKMIQNIYGQVNQRAGQAANVGIDWDKFMLNYLQNQDQIDQRQDMFKKQQMMDWITKGAAALAGGLTGFGGMAASTPAATAGASGGITSTPGGLADWYKKVYGG